MAIPDTDQSNQSRTTGPAEAHGQTSAGPQAGPLTAFSVTVYFLEIHSQDKNPNLSVLCLCISSFFSGLFQV